MTMYETLQKTAGKLRDRAGEAPDVALALGSGLSPFADRLEDSVEIPYSDLSDWPGSTVPGHRGALVVGSLHGKRLAVMAGRAHLYEGYPVGSVVFGVRALRIWGASTYLVTNSAGGVSSRLDAGDLMLIKDHLNLQGTNPLIGPNDERLGVRFPDMSHAYDPALRDVARNAAKKLEVDLKEGVYAALPGPSYETPAEVRMLAGLGADAVGMSTVPEVIAARHMGMAVLGISCISNLAAGLADQPLTHEEVTQTAGRVREKFEGLVDEIIRSM